MPRTQSEEARLLATEPEGWEYLLFGAVLLRKRDELDPRWREHLARYRAPSEPLGEHEALEQMSSVFSEVTAIVDNIGRHFSLDAQERAFGKPGEPGDPQRIIELAESVIADYRELLDWSARLRLAGLPARFRQVFDLASDYTDSPLRQFHDFVDHVVHDLDDLPAAIREGRPFKVVANLTLSVEDGLQERLSRELDRVSAKWSTEMKQETKRLERETSRIEGQASRLHESSGENQPRERRGLKRMFEAHHAKTAAKEYEKALAEWTAERDGAAERLALANYQGEQSTDILLKPGEAVFATISVASLVEDRSGPGQWQGRSSGVSFPIGSVGGRSIRYRIGASRGHFVQGQPTPTAIDTGTLFVTDRRIVFQGLKQTRECLFDKLVGFRHTPDGSTVFSVSNRQKATTIHYGPALSDWFDFRLDLALAHHRGELPAFVAQLESDLAEANADKPGPTGRAP